MKIIVCTGDSHTWGQGSTDPARPGIHAEDCFDPPAEGGDLRPMPFCYTSYVNLLREAIAERFPSSSAEYSAEALEKQHALSHKDGCAVLKEPLTLALSGELIRIFFRRRTDPASVSLVLDGKPCGVFDLLADAVDYGFHGLLQIPLFCSAGEHTLEIRGSESETLLYRIETYSGEYAVINSAVGSCPTTRYLSDYFEDFVGAYHPDVILAEAHTINDWLTACSAEEYDHRLTEYLFRMQETGAKVAMLSVSPILGSQTAPGADTLYESMITASLHAAKTARVPVADAHKKIADAVSGMDEAQSFSEMFADCWHVNDRGHKIYADCALSVLLPLLCEL